MPFIRWLQLLVFFTNFVSPTVSSSRLHSNLQPLDDEASVLPPWCYLWPNQSLIWSLFFLPAPMTMIGLKSLTLGWWGKLVSSTIYDEYWEKTSYFCLFDNYEFNILLAFKEPSWKDFSTSNITSNIGRDNVHTNMSLPCWKKCSFGFESKISLVLKCFY